jgi:hypothetical protein
MKPQELSGLFQYLAVSYSSLLVSYLFGSVIYLYKACGIIFLL